MGKQPAFQFYTGDWVQDTRSLSLATKGAWIDILCALWRSQTRGSLTLPILGWARLISATVDQTEAVIKELVDMHICKCVMVPVCNGTSVTRNANITDRNENITLINRRMVREYNDAQQNVERQRKFREKHKTINECNRDNNGDSNAKITPPSSSSSSSSSLNLKKEIYKEKEKPIVETGPLSTSPPSNHFRENATEILKFLNTKTGRNYELTKVNLDFIVNRLKEGSTPGQCRQVVAKKCREWLTDEKMTLYLRPATLFNKTKFAQYRGELIAIPENEEEEIADAKMS